MNCKDCTPQVRFVSEPESSETNFAYGVKSLLVNLKDGHFPLVGTLQLTGK